jgi:hypothetical protein
MKKYLIILLAAMAASPLGAKDYNASLFGIKSDGTSMNTTSIQKAIDYIHENGGGRLVFYVGRYLTGSIRFKSNVQIHLNEGAVLVGSENPYDYAKQPDMNNEHALLIAKHAHHIALTGKGVVDGRGRQLSYNIITQVQHGLIADPLNNDRPTRPRLLYFRECDSVRIDGVTLTNAADWVQFYDQCRYLTINNITVRSTNYWNNDGLDIVDCEEVLVSNSFIDASDDAICLKSHDRTKACRNIVIRNCTARSSASGVKFGTVSAGGFINVALSNIRVYDTYRSAFTVQAVDGGFAENISIDSLYVYNTGNAVFLRVGNRWSDGRQSYMKNIAISNVYAEITDKKPDAGYMYEGPIEDLPRNISPCGIVGLKGQDINGVTLTNVEIITVGGGNADYAKRGLSPAELDAIPELPAAYPEFSQWKELPAWGFYIRHATGIVFNNVTLTAQARDYRPAIVLDDVKNSDLRAVTCIAPGKKKAEVHVYQSSGIRQH